MMRLRPRAILALLAGGAILVVARWFDAEVLREAQGRMAATFEVAPFIWSLSLGYVITAAAVLLVGLLAWWSRSLLVAIVYSLAGAFLASYLAVDMVYAEQVNDAPSVLPHPLADLWTVWYRVMVPGPLQTLFVVGAGMLLAGLGGIGLSIRRRLTQGGSMTAGGGVAREPEPASSAGIEDLP
jgi:hypothetical protein